MLRLLKYAAALAFLVGVSAAHAFVTLGPVNEAYQIPDLGYGLTSPGVDLGAPKNIGEDYRRTTPVLYYAFDESFLDYFGTNGVAAVDAAMAILNNLTNASSYSAGLSEVPLEATRYNQTAMALNLLDLKSETLNLMMEQLGLGDPLRYVWGLHDRVVTGTCPLGNEYLVDMRNYDIVPSDLDQLQYSEVINEQLYSYYIVENCTTPPTPLSFAQSFSVDITENANRFAPVASGLLFFGSFYTSLTRDDVAALRYLLRSGHVHWEDTPAGSTVEAPGPLQLLVTSNLTTLAQASLTNDDATLLGLYPDLTIVPNSTVSSFATVVTTNVSIYFTNSPLDPAGTPPSHQVIANTYTTNVVLVYNRQFANVVTNSFSTVGFVTIVDTSLVFSPNMPVGSPPTTNTTTHTMLTNLVSGDFYILSVTNCGVQILSNVLTTAMQVTNTVVSTNAPTTNAPAGTYLLSRTFINWFTNHNLAISPILCSTNEPGLRRGVEKLTFVKTAFDSLLGRSYTPQTNFFTMTMVTNSTNWTQTYQRVVTQPDFLFTAADMAPGPAATIAFVMAARNIFWNSNNVLPGLAGPGTIDPPSSFTFNKVGPVFFNQITTNGTYFMDQKSGTLQALWGSFDDSTNAPVVYPNGTSIASIESQMMMQVTSVTLPNGQAGHAYSTQLTGSGGSPPYTWTLAPNSTTLPPGLALATNGILSGAPTTSGIFSFFVQMTGTNGGFTVWQVTITVLP